MSTARSHLRQLQIADKKMIPVHVSWDEIRSFNIMQGKQMVDPVTGLREYPLLGLLFKNKLIQKLFVEILEAVKLGTTKGPLKTFIEDLDISFGDGVEKIPSDEDPEVHKIEEGGENPDKKVVLLPTNVAAFFDALQGGEKLSPHDHLLEYGFFSEVLRIAAPVVGFAFGGPGGAAAGSALAHVATGNKDIGSILKNAGFAGTLGLGAGALGVTGGSGLGAMASSIPGLSGLSGLGGAGIAGTTAAAPVAATAAATTAATPAAATGLASWLPGKEAALPIAALVAGGLMAAKGGQKEHQEAKKQAEENNENQRGYLKASGWGEPLGVRLRTHWPTPHQDTLPAARLSAARRHIHKKGDLVLGKPILGPGKGQEDLIPCDSTKRGDWIWDASTTSDLGDGTTDAGFKEIRKIEKWIQKVPGFKSMPEFTGGEIPPKVKTALSNGEYKTPARLVTALGQGDNEKGASILRKMTQDIRLHKISKGHELPPAIGNPMQFLHKAINEEMHDHD